MVAPQLGNSTTKEVHLDFLVSVPRTRLVNPLRSLVVSSSFSHNAVCMLDAGECFNVV